MTSSRALHVSKGNSGGEVHKHTLEQQHTSENHKKRNVQAKSTKKIAVIY